MDAWAALRWQVEWGADEALEEQPVRRLAPPGQVAAEPVALRPAPPPRPVAVPAATPRAASTLPVVSQAERVAQAAASIEALQAALASFEGCALRDTATNLVFADGNEQAGLILIGEGPGAEEDREGRPFVGASGRLLDRMLASIGLDRTRVLITNVIPWRPPGNRAPTDTEILVCLPFLLRHVALVRPRRLVLLGGMATKSLTGQVQGIRRLRGRWIEVAIPGLPGPIPALPVLHPAYLLRTPGAKRDAWADWLLLRRTLDADSAVAAS